MSNAFFKFKEFCVDHSRCAMKVGTDGVMLGAWANGGDCILDIGTGSGVIALFMAQRNVNSRVVAIDIDSEAVAQARLNVERSIYNERITVIETALQDFHDQTFNSIVCNPPFFANSLRNKDVQRSIARHTDTLSYGDLFRGAMTLLDEDGEFSVVIPASCRYEFDAEATFAGLFPSRICSVRTVSRKPVSRYLLAYRKHPVDMIEETGGCINNDDMSRTEWYRSLTQDFYLK